MKTGAYTSVFRISTQGIFSVFGHELQGRYAENRELAQELPRR
jgi:hypothetical protein